MYKATHNSVAADTATTSTAVFSSKCFTRVDVGAVNESA